MIENLKKHVGTLSNTGVRVVVVFRKLPNDDSSCLIIETERLPDSYQDYVNQCLNSRESLGTNDFYEVLNRRSFPDGANCLTALHQRGFLRKEPVTNITMYPLPNRAVPLALINSQIDKTVYVPEPDPAKPTEVFEIDPVEHARGILAKAAELEAQVTQLREQAYGLAPHLKPTKGRPALTPEQRAESQAKRKEKRKVRDREIVVEERVAKRESALDAKVAAKLARDAERQTSTAAE